MTERSDFHLPVECAFPKLTGRFPGVVFALRGDRIETDHAWEAFGHLGGIGQHPAPEAAVVVDLTHQAAVVGQKVLWINLGRLAGRGVEATVVGLVFGLVLREHEQGEGEGAEGRRGARSSFRVEPLFHPHSNGFSIGIPGREQVVGRQSE